ncbi:acetyltransferase [Halomonas sp. MA07-2]|uniref:acetyltransferase n=1 Tax=Halomonas sp. MA07-2 TaxID=3440841 RepID=UPI003EE9B454
MANARELVIIGASGFGKEVAWLARRLGITVKGFLDDDPVLKSEKFYTYPVLGSVASWPEYAASNFIIAIASPRIRKKIVTEMRHDGSPQFATLVDPQASVELEFTQLGQGTVICAGSVITAAVSIGEHCIVNKLCSVGHDVVVEAFSTIAPKVMLSGFVHLHQGSEVGAASAIRQNVRVGRGAMVGMGSIVLKDVPDNTLVVGSPARHLKNIEAL